LEEGALMGATYALQKPPMTRETKVELKIFDKAIWQSPRIIFNPQRTRGIIIKWRHKRIWLMVRYDVEHGVGLKEIIKNHSPKITDETLRKLLKREHPVN
jgi:predicted oxidoreductase (fatty acid repression mutant protein)